MEPLYGVSEETKREGSQRNFCRFMWNKIDKIWANFVNFVLCETKLTKFEQIFGYLPMSGYGNNENTNCYR